MSLFNQVEGSTFIHGDFTDSVVQNALIDFNKGEKVDLIVSDMCPEFSGEKLVDDSKLFDLNVAVVKFCKKLLKKNGTIIMKTFQGSMSTKIEVKL